MKSLKQKKLRQIEFRGTIVTHCHFKPRERERERKKTKRWRKNRNFSLKIFGREETRAITSVTRALC